MPRATGPELENGIPMFLTQLVEVLQTSPVSRSATRGAARAPRGTAGALAGDEALKREGKIDQLVGKAKQVAGKVLDKAKAITKRA